MNARGVDKACKSYGQAMLASGERGSNTCLTYPPVGHNQEKSWLIPNRSISHKTLWIKPTFVGAGGKGHGRSASW